MKNHQIWKGAGAVAATLSLLTVLALSGCGSSQTTTSTSAAQAQTASFTATESISLLSASYQVDLQNAVKITLSGTSASTSGSGVSVSGSTVTMTAGGTSALSGTLTTGTVVGDAKGQTVVLALNGASIAASSGAAINVQNAELAVVYTVSGTDNALSGYNTDATDTNAALYSKDNLILDGEGSLSVTDTGNNGIQSKDSLAVLGGTVTVSAANHGIKANDSLEVTDGTITITCGGDGLKSASTDSTDAGLRRHCDRYLFRRRRAGRILPHRGGRHAGSDLRHRLRRLPDQRRRQHPHGLWRRQYRQLRRYDARQFLRFFRFLRL